MLSFTQLNLHKAAQATMLVGRGMEGSRQSVLLLTEPHTVGNRIVGMPQGTKGIYMRPNAQAPAPRAGIIISSDVKATVMESWCNRDCAVALARVAGKQTVIVSLYMDITLDVRPAWLEKLMKMVSDKKYALILGVDSNAHSSLYGPNTNARGKLVEDFILEHGLSVENIGQAPTFETRRGNRIIQTHIDVTLSRDMPNAVKNWAVNRDYNASDHNSIIFQIEEHKPEPELVRPWGKADWNELRRVLEGGDVRIPKDMSMKKLDKLVDRTYDLLESALDAACPKIEVNPTVKKSHWATEVHDEGKQKVTELYRAAKRSRDSAQWERYKKADRDFKKLCKRDKNRAWRTYKAVSYTHLTLPTTPYV